MKTSLTVKILSKYYQDVDKSLFKFVCDEDDFSVFIIEFDNPQFGSDIAQDSCRSYVTAKLGWEIPETSVIIDWDNSVY